YAWPRVALGYPTMLLASARSDVAPPIVPLLRMRIGLHGVGLEHALPVLVDLECTLDAVLHSLLVAHRWPLGSRRVLPIRVGKPRRSVLAVRFRLQTCVVTAR